VPDFLTPPPRTSRPSLRSQLAEIRATDRRKYHASSTGAAKPWRTSHTAGCSPVCSPIRRAHGTCSPPLGDAWASLVAPYCVRIRALLDRDVEERSRALTRHGLRRVLDELHPKLRWTTPGLSLADHDDRTVHVDGRGLLLMPSAYLWPHVASTVEEP
jgi:hypothetical protein